MGIFVASPSISFLLASILLPSEVQLSFNCELTRWHSFAVQTSEAAWEARENPSFPVAPVDLSSRILLPLSAGLVIPGSERSGTGCSPSAPG